MVRNSSRLSTTAVAAATALSLVMGCGVAAADTDTTGENTTAATGTTSGDTPTGTTSGDTPADTGNTGTTNGTGTDDTTATDETTGAGGTGDTESHLIDNIPDYAHPGLSSGPSSEQPGIIWHARGLSSKIVDPIKGYKGILIGLIVIQFAMAYTNTIVSITNDQRIARGEQPLPFPHEAAAQAFNALSSQLNIPGPQLPPLPRR